MYNKVYGSSNKIISTEICFVGRIVPKKKSPENKVRLLGLLFTLLSSKFTNH